jgi:hypothetical protein
VNRLHHPYAEPSYAATLGTPQEVPEWGAPVLLRPIPETSWRDAAGCYPLTPLSPGADLGGGLARLQRAELVSVVIVPDPIYSPPLSSLAEAFSVCRPFKTHYIFRRDRPLQLNPNHRRNIKRAEATCSFQTVKLDAILRDWLHLYRGLIAKRQVSGAADFTDGYFEELAKLPGITAIVAYCSQQLVAASLWLDHCDVTYYHLGASSSRGYAASAMFGLFARAIEGCQTTMLNFGGNAGLADDGGGGLSRFKRGFANATAETYICGAVLDDDRYSHLGGPATAFFPRYRCWNPGAAGGS